MSATSDAWPIYQNSGQVTPLEDILSAIGAFTIYQIADTSERATLIAALTAKSIATDYLVTYRLDATDGQQIEYTDDGGTTWYALAALGSAGVPYRQSVGTSNITFTASATATGTITFPASRFSQAPIVVATAPNSNINIAVSSIATANATVAGRTTDGSTISGTYAILWTATQMTSAAAAG